MNANGGKKFKLVEQEKIGDCLYWRIEALRDIPMWEVEKGERGGLIEKEENLSQFGNSWVEKNARVGGGARVCGNAIIFKNGYVRGNMRIGGNAVVGGAMICGEGRIGGNTQIGEAWPNDVDYFVPPF